MAIPGSGDANPQGDNAIVDAIEANTACLEDLKVLLGETLSVELTAENIAALVASLVAALEDATLNVELTAENIADLVAALLAEDFNVNIVGSDITIDVNIAGQDNPITVTLDQATLDALEDLNLSVTVTGFGEDVVLTVTLDQDTLDAIQEIIDNIILKDWEFIPNKCVYVDGAKAENFDAIFCTYTNTTGTTVSTVMQVLDTSVNPPVVSAITTQEIGSCPTNQKANITLFNADLNGDKSPYAFTYAEMLQALQDTLGASVNVGNITGVKPCLLACNNGVTLANGTEHWIGQDPYPLCDADGNSVDNPQGTTGYSGAVTPMSDLDAAEAQTWGSCQGCKELPNAENFVINLNSGSASSIEVCYTCLPSNITAAKKESEGKK